MSTTAKDLIFDAPLFRELEDVDRQRLGEITSVKQFSRGEEIFREGSPPEFSYLIVTGRVKIFKITPAGRDIILELFSAGDLFGAIAAYRGIPYPASAAALEDATLLQVPQKKFFMLLEQHPSLVRGLLLSLTQRLVQLTNRIASLTGGRLEPRFARLFLKLADEVGKSGPEGQVVPLALSRQELADMTGTTIETCIRLMSRWSKEGIVRTEKDGFVLLDRKTLEQVSLD
ncbi:MAG TPA: Crp/Fnr family transcriptional regulator [Vicinamibacterales bacterium]|jgi:CRP/FNR family transcriptional regulator|nr:Crp/Fnr family transcriptional regulator [Vicinamibacterales bacterium]|tara:strand:+ start:1978 stop:2667 length:690 start_codon:yes stop_codon:yes gene_type:complete